MTPPLLPDYHGNTGAAYRAPELTMTAHRRRELRVRSLRWSSWTLSPRQKADLEMIVVGGFAPLTGFMGSADLESVCSRSRLVDGSLWPMPITLEMDSQTAAGLAPGDPLVLRDEEGTPLAIQHVEELWQPDLKSLCRSIYGTLDSAHPSVNSILEKPDRVFVGGPIEALEPPIHHDLLDLRWTPERLRRRFCELGWQRIVAFQTRNPLHRAHFELTQRAALEADAKLLIHPVVGPTRPGDLDRFVRTRCYRAVLDRYPPGSAMLAVLPLAMRLAGPREALLHVIVRKNYGCTHMIIGRDHAGPGVDSNGQAYYPPYAAQERVREHQEELGIEMIPFQDLVYVEDPAAGHGSFLPSDQVTDPTRARKLSGTELRQRLRDGRELPEWFTFPEVAAELRKSFPPRHQKGLTIFFTGLSGAGKSTLARVLHNKLLELGDRPVTLLDGDLVRRNLSSELGFSKPHRDLNIRRIGFVASEITKNRGIALCAPIAPYDELRKEVRATIEAHGGFILVHVATPLEVCERRDRKGLYAKARAGLIDQFTGISDPYETPTDADLTLDTTESSPIELVRIILEHLQRQGYLRTTAR